MPSDGEQSDDSAEPVVRTVLLRSLPPSKWQVVKKGMPLGKAVAYCKAKGVKVNLDLMVPEELHHA
jgi:hypothetical protein